MPEYWGGWPFPSPGDLPDQGIKPVSPALQADSLPTEHPILFIYFFTVYFVLGHDWLTMLWWFQVSSKGIQPYMCLYLPSIPLPSRLPHNTEQSSTCSTVGSSCTLPFYIRDLSILEFWNALELLEHILPGIRGKIVVGMLVSFCYCLKKKKPKNRKLNYLQQCEFITLPLWRSDIWNMSHWAKNWLCYLLETLVRICRFFSFSSF